MTVVPKVMYCGHGDVHDSRNVAFRGKTGAVMLALAANFVSVRALYERGGVRVGDVREEGEASTISIAPIATLMPGATSNPMKKKQIKTKAIEFKGFCLGCRSDNSTPRRGGLRIQLDGDEPVENGETACLDCAERLARRLKKRARECRDKIARGLEYRNGKWQEPKTKAESPTQEVAQ